MPTVATCYRQLQSVADGCKVLPTVATCCTRPLSLQILLDYDCIPVSPSPSRGLPTTQLGQGLTFQLGNLPPVLSFDVVSLMLPPAGSIRRPFSTCPPTCIDLVAAGAPFRFPVSPFPSAPSSAPPSARPSVFHQLLPAVSTRSFWSSFPPLSGTSGSFRLLPTSPLSIRWQPPAVTTGHRWIRATFTTLFPATAPAFVRIVRIVR